jgi:hypothetical protein
MPFRLRFEFGLFLQVLFYYVVSLLHHACLSSQEQELVLLLRHLDLHRPMMNAGLRRLALLPRLHVRVVQRGFQGAALWGMCRRVDQHELPRRPQRVAVRRLRLPIRVEPSRRGCLGCEPLLFGRAAFQRHRSYRLHHETIPGCWRPAPEHVVHCAQWLGVQRFLGAEEPLEGVAGWQLPLELAVPLAG